MRLLGTERGTTVTGAGAELTVYRHWVKVHVANTCGHDGERVQGQATRGVTWSIDTDEGGVEWLTLSSDDGTVEKYRRWIH
jgi:hypothetical protein